LVKTILTVAAKIDERLRRSLKGPAGPQTARTSAAEVQADHMHSVGSEALQLLLVLKHLENKDLSLRLQQYQEILNSLRAYMSDIARAMVPSVDCAIAEDGHDRSDFINWNMLCMVVASGLPLYIALEY